MPVARAVVSPEGLTGGELLPRSLTRLLASVPRYMGRSAGLSYSMAAGFPQGEPSKG